jgi:hypothetical protein
MSGSAGKRTPKRSTNSGTLAGSISSPVAVAEVAEDGWVCLCDAAEVDEFRKEALEAAGAMISRIRPGVVAGVPERVPLAAGPEDEVAGAGFEHVVTEERSHAAFEHVAVFVFA